MSLSQTGGLFEISSSGLTMYFHSLFPRKKDELPVGNLRKLVNAFDTVEDPVLPMKLSSVKQGVKGTIALTQSHGKKGD
jgi:hypothetical protein